MEPYQEKIAKLVFDYVKHDKAIDGNYLCTIICIMISEYDVSNFLNGVCVKKGDYPEAEYNSISKKLRINIKRINEQFEIPNCILQSKEANYFSFIYFNTIILHEFSHMKQAKQNVDFKETNTDIESKLVYLSNKLWNLLTEYKVSLYLHLLTVKIKDVKYYYNIYNTYYNLDVSERLANLEAHQISHGIASILGLPITSDYEKLREYNLYTTSRPNTSPTLEYLDKLYRKEELVELKTEIANANLSLDERLRLGLHINEEEYEILVGEEQELNRKLDLYTIYERM